MEKISRMGVVVLVLGLVFGFSEVSFAEEKSLVGYWKFDEAKGDIAKDSSGMGNDGTIRGGIWTKGVSGTALQFDGSDDYVDCGTNSSLNINNAITIEVWVNPDTVHSGRIVSKRHKNITPSNYELVYRSGPIQFGYRDGSSWQNYKTDDDITVGKWHHVAMSYTFGTGSSMKIYVNGNEMAGGWYTGDGDSAVKITDSPLKIGALWPPKEPNAFNGIIDEVRIYNRALSQKEIQAHYEKGKSGVASELLAESSREKSNDVVEGPPFYTGNILPTPQQVEYKDSFITVFDHDNSIKACILAGEEEMEDSRIKELENRITDLGGKIEIKSVLAKDLADYKVIISVGKSGANRFNNVYLRKLKISIPEQEQGYVIKFIHEKRRKVILCIGKDDLGTYWSIQSLKQLLFRKDEKVLLREVAVYDYPLHKDRAYMANSCDIDKYVKFCEWAPRYKFNKVFTSGTMLRCLLTGIKGSTACGWRNPVKKENVKRRLQEMIGYLAERDIDFIWTTHPAYVKDLGNPHGKYKIQISDPKDIDHLIEIYEIGLEAGAGGIALWLDDVCFPMRPEDKEHFGDAARAHTYLWKELCNRLKPKYPEMEFYFVPPYYWTGLTKKYEEKYGAISGKEYLKYIGSEFPKEVKFFWSGPNVTSKKVTLADIQKWYGCIGRKDNTAYFDNYFGISRYWGVYFFDEQDFNAVFPPDFLDYVTLHFAGLCAGHRFIAMAVLSDWVWNPEKYDPRRAFKEAVAKEAGPGMYPLLIDWRAKISRFDPYMKEILRKEFSNKTRQALPQLMEWYNELDKSYKKVESACPNKLIVEGMKNASERVKDYIKDLTKKYLEDLGG